MTMAAILRTDKPECVTPYTPAVAIVAGAMLQGVDGRPCITTRAIAADAVGNLESHVRARCLKTADVVLLRGMRAYVDHSAQTVTYNKVNDRDFYLGRVAADAAAGDTTVDVDVGYDPPYDIDLRQHSFDSTPVGTAAAGGFGYPKALGAARLIELTATNEAQKIDLFSTDRFSKNANPLIEYEIRVPVNGSGAAVDFNIGIANGTHATDFDSITEYVAFHVDGGSLDILAQSADGTTTVAATDTTVNLTAGSAVANRFMFTIDASDTENVLLYINGVRVISDSAFKINNATGPFGLIAHLEKTSGTTTGQFIIDRATVLYRNQ